MKQHTITLYDYSELSKEAKERAHSKWRENNSYPFLTEYLREVLTGELDALGITYTPDSLKLYYSLSYCQGDGAMFEGWLQWNDYEVRIVHSDPHYYHSNTARMDWYKDDGEVDAPEWTAIDFKTMYREVCRKLERSGYDYIENEDSEETFADLCEANEWTFEEDGTMRNVVAS